MPVIAHLSDPHVDAGPHRLQRLRRVLDEIAQLDHVDMLMVTGDIADNGTHAEYAQFFDALTLPLPTLVVPGNHDRRDPMSTFLPDSTPETFLNSTLTVDGMTIVGLDTLVEGEDHGMLSDETLDYARRAIDAAPGHVVLAMHHPPVPVGHHVVDELGLRNNDALAELIRYDDKVMATCTGHVHTALSATFAERPLVGAPGIVSTMRLGSRTDPVADTDAMPGLALLTLDDAGRLRTIFHYLSPA